jgi:hypothetical protein
VGRFDDAVWRQIDVILMFPQFDEAVTSKVWRRYLEETKKRIAAEREKVVIAEYSILEFASEMYRKQRFQQRRQLNGSQIRNLFATALASAKYEYMSKDKTRIPESEETIVLDKGVFKRAVSSSLNIDDFMSGEIWTETYHSTFSSPWPYTEKSVNLRQDRFLDEYDSMDEIETEDLAIEDPIVEGLTLEALPVEDRPLEASQAKDAFASRLSALPNLITIEKPELHSIVEKFCNNKARIWTLRGIDKTIRLAIVFAMYDAWRNSGYEENAADNIALRGRHFEVEVSIGEEFKSYLEPTWGGDEEERVSQMRLRSDNFT